MPGIRGADRAFRCCPTENPVIQTFGVAWAYLVQRLCMAGGIPSAFATEPDIGGRGYSNGLRELILC